MSWTQCGGHGPPCATNDEWSAGCQSRVAIVSANRASAANALIGAITSSPAGTASAPPGRKSFCTSTISSA